MVSNATSTRPIFCLKMQTAGFQLVTYPEVNAAAEEVLLPAAFVAVTEHA